MNRQNTKNPGSAQCSALGESFGNEISKSVPFADASESVKSAHTYTPPGPSEILASAAVTTILIRYMGIVGSRLLTRTLDRRFVVSRLLARKGCDLVSRLLARKVFQSPVGDW